MARQLASSGEDIALLALLDTRGEGFRLHPQGTSPFMNWVYTNVDRVRNHWLGLRSRTLKQKAAYVSEATHILIARSWLRWRTGRNNDVPENVLRVYRANVIASRNYVLKPHTGVVTLFRAVQQPSGSNADATLGWETLAKGGVVVHDVPGFHGECIRDPYVAVLADKLVACLEQVQQESI